MDNPTTPLGRIALIPLHDRKGEVVAHAIIDAADLGDVGRWPWCLAGTGYVWRNSKNDPDHASHVTLHRYLMGCKVGDGMYVDHINRDRLDNRRGNLRVLTPAQAAQNKPALKGRFRGVTWDKAKGKWAAQAQLNGKHHFLGRFDREEDADRAAREWRANHMPFAVDDVA